MTTKRKIKRKRKGNPDTILCQYIKKNNGRRIGVMVGTVKNDSVMIGWSWANVNKGDKFDAKKGLKLATERLKAQEIVPVPHSIFNNMIIFQDRCFRYFKNKSTKVHKIAIQNLPKTFHEEIDELDILIDG